MEPQHRKIWPAATLLILAAAAAVFCLFRLSQPDRMQTSLLLNCTQTNRNGWTFETESGPAEPVFGFGGYLDGIPVGGDSPVAAERVMEEPGQRDLLQFFGFGTGIQVFLDGELLYTDFPNEENRADSFLEDVDFSSISHDGLCIPLPIDCAGKTLRIVTYDTALNGLLYPTFPSQSLFRLCDRCFRHCLAHGGHHSTGHTGAFPAAGFPFQRPDGAVSVETAAAERLFSVGGGACGVRLILRAFCRIGYNGQFDRLALSHLY